MIEMDTTIAKVTVYPDRARVLRTGVVELEAGLHTLAIPELPVSLDRDSVRAAGRGSAQARLLGVSAELTYYRESPAERVRKLEREIESLEDKDRSLQNEQTVLKAQLDHLEGLASHTETFAKGLAFGRTQVSDQAALMSYLRETGAGIMDEMQKIGIAGRELAKTLKKLRDELDQLRDARPRQRYTAKIELEITQAGSFQADLIYTIRNASWRPLYDLRLWEAKAEGEKPRLEATYLGQVQQSTGEDWNNVELILSTARPAVSGSLPELDPWYLDIKRPPPPPSSPMPERKKGRPPMPAMAQPEAGAPPEAEPTPVAWKQAAVAFATVDTSGAAVTFHVSGRANIPSDGQPHKTTVATYSLEPKLDYVTAPKLEEVAHRRARVVNTTEAVFLPGTANVFAGDEFIGVTKLEHVAPTEEFELSLGVDDRIKVKRELVIREVDRSLIGDKRRLRYGYQIEVENLRPVTETILVADHYPLPRHEQVKVRLESVEPKPTEATEMHLLDWELRLQAGQKQTIRFEVQIEHPRALSVDGLPD